MNKLEQKIYNDLIKVADTGEFEDMRRELNIYFLGGGFMKKQIRAYIKQDTKNSESLWLVTERTEKGAKDVDLIMGMFRDEDNMDNIAYPILKDEVPAILEACKKYLEEVK